MRDAFQEPVFDPFRLLYIVLVYCPALARMCVKTRPRFIVLMPILWHSDTDGGVYQVKFVNSGFWSANFSQTHVPPLGSFTTLKI